MILLKGLTEYLPVRLDASPEPQITLGSPAGDMPLADALSQFAR